MCIVYIKVKSPHRWFVSLLLVSFVNMTPFVKFLLFFAVNLIIGVNSNAISRDKRADFAKRVDRNTYYNIYTKINTLERGLKKLETTTQKRTKLLREVLKSVIGIDSNLGNTVISWQKFEETNMASKKIVNFKSLLFSFILFENVKASDCMINTFKYHFS